MEGAILHLHEENKYMLACLGPKDNSSPNLQNTAPER